MQIVSGLIRIGAALLALAAGAASAHEFWMLPDSFRVPAGGTLSLSLRVGENFNGELVGLSRPLFLALRDQSAAATVDLTDRVPAGRAVGAVAIGPAQAGTHVLAADTQPSHIVLPGGRFHAYLHDEGLDFIIKLREAAGTDDSPGRERFRRHVKALVQVGATADTAALQPTGQRLEIVPLADPLRQPAGRDLGLQVLFEGRPLAGALVKLWHQRGGQTLIIRAVADAQGKVTVTPPWPGLYMASVVHMIAAADSPDDDWDSFWGNLSFDVPP